MKGLLGSAQRFLKGGTYNQGGVKSIGGRIGTNKSYVGGSVGLDKGRPFGSYNVNGQVKGSFGPQGK